MGYSLFGDSDSDLGDHVKPSVPVGMNMYESRYSEVSAPKYTFKQLVQPPNSMHPQGCGGPTSVVPWKKLFR